MMEGLVVAMGVGKKVEVAAASMLLLLLLSL